MGGVFSLWLSLMKIASLSKHPSLLKVVTIVIGDILLLLSLFFLDDVMTVREPDPDVFTVVGVGLMGTTGLENGVIGVIGVTGEFSPDLGTILH